MQYINLRGSLTRNVDSRTTPVKRRLAAFLANPLNIWESRELALFSSEYYSGDIWNLQHSHIFTGIASGSAKNGRLWTNYLLLAIEL
jgi:hypothetical protein